MVGMLSAIVLSVASLVPAKGWFAPDQPVVIRAEEGIDAATTSLVLTEFGGTVLEPGTGADVTVEEVKDLRQAFPQIATPGTYVLYAVKEVKRTETGGTAPIARRDPPRDFLGTPLVIEVRSDAREAAPRVAMVVRVAPLRYAMLHTDAGPPMTVVFYYDAAPHTVDHFLSLAREGFYDGLTFHRIVPDFVVQGGDPKGDGTGGPGFRVDGEFNDRQHFAGVLSMARAVDPMEAGGMPPRQEFADTAGSQFFICLDNQTAAGLDGKYTAFGQLVGKTDALKAIAGVPLADPRAGRPEKPPVIEKIEVKDVTAAHNPYGVLFRALGPTTAPTAAPAGR